MVSLTPHSYWQYLKNFQQLFDHPVLTLMDQSASRHRLFPPLIVLKGFISQFLSASHSCRDAVIFLIQNFGIKASLSTAAYCRARQKLSSEHLQTLLTVSGERLSSGKNRVLWVDGTLLAAEDSIVNREEYPHSNWQRPGLGQPKVRVLGIFDSGSGACVLWKMGKYKGVGQAEPSLLRGMLSELQTGDTLVMDRFFTSPDLLQEVLKLEMHFIVRLRDQTGIRFLGKRRTQGVFEHKGMQVRIVKVSLQKKGYRCHTLFIMSDFTTLAATELERLYAGRWGIEVAFRHLKSTLGLSLLRTKTPKMLKIEILVGLITYNLVCAALGLCRKLNQVTRTLSFKCACRFLLGSVLTYEKILTMIESLKTSAFTSPYRREPRALKRRHNRYPLLTVPRDQSHKQVWGYERRANKPEYIIA